MQEWRDELRTARDFVLAARSAVRIADKRAAIAACDAACDAACAILHRISQQESAPPPAAEPEPPEPQQQQQQAAPVMLLAAPAAGGESSGVAGEGAPRWERPDPPARAKLIKSSSTSASYTEAHDHSAQLAFALSLARDAYLEVRPEAVWDNEDPVFLHEDPLQGFCRLVLRIFEDGLREDEVVLERKTEGRISGLVVYKLAGRNSEAMLQLLGFASRAGLGRHLHQELVRDVRRRYPPPITLRLEVASCISKLYEKHHWKGDGRSGGQLQLTLEEVPRPRGRAPAGKRCSARLGEWVPEEDATAMAVEEENEEAAQDLGVPVVVVSAPTDAVRRVYASYDTEADSLAALGSYSLNYTPASVLTITNLLGLEEGECVLWVGAGDGREALSVALLHPGCRIVCLERNEALVGIAQRVQASLSVQNIRFEHADAMHLPSTEGFTHVFSTALSGAARHSVHRNVARQVADDRGGDRHDHAVRLGRPATIAGGNDEGPGARGQDWCGSCRSSSAGHDPALCAWARCKAASARG